MEARHTSHHLSLCFFSTLSSWANDLDVTLTHPDGTSVILFTDIGTGDDLDVVKDIILDDEASENIADTILTENPRGTPEVESLSIFYGKSVLGAWQLQMTDDSFGDSGFFYSMYFRVTCAAEVETSPPTIVPSQIPTTTISSAPSMSETSLPTIAPSQNSTISNAPSVSETSLPTIAPSQNSTL